MPHSDEFNPSSDQFFDKLWRGIHRWISAIPFLVFWENDQAADEGKWVLRINAKALRLRTLYWYQHCFDQFRFTDSRSDIHFQWHRIDDFRCWYKTRGHQIACYFSFFDEWGCRCHRDSFKRARSRKSNEVDSNR